VASDTRLSLAPVDKHPMKYTKQRARLFLVRALQGDSQRRDRVSKRTRIHTRAIIYTDRADEAALIQERLDRNVFDGRAVSSLAESEECPPGIP
jgi:hypothetical protein